MSKHTSIRIPSGETLKSKVLYPSLAAAVLALCMFGLADFAGFIPGTGAHQDIYDAVSGLTRPAFAADSKPARS